VTPRLLVEHVDAITLDGEVEQLSDVAIAIEGATIRSVGATPKDFTPDERIDGSGLLALPGFYNAHCHSPMSLQRGWAEDLPFDRWLNERVWVAESALEEEDVYWGAALAACEMLRAGIVGFADHYFWMDQVARVVEESGMKALLAWCYFGRGQDQEVGRITLDTTRAFVQRWQGAAGGRVRTAFGPHSPYMCPPDALREVAAAAARLDAPIHLHLAESSAQVQASLEQHGRRPVAHVAALGVLDGPTIAAHCIAVDEHDVEQLARSGAVVAHTPKTYMKLAMDPAPLAALMAAEVDVALGTDGPASNSDLNLLEVLRLVGLQQKQQRGSAEAAPIDQLLRMACQAGARALGFSDSGVLKAGAAADLVLFDTRGPHWCPRHDLGAAVVYGSHPSDVRHVIVNGRILLRDGELVTLDEERICREAERRGFRMVGRKMTRMRRYEN
jgi:5-methylthioadenosine/S-adenosylhomocysteine deaminase